MSTVREAVVRTIHWPEGRGIDVEWVKRDFPILEQKVHGKPLVYLDNAATTQKPQLVIDTLGRYYTTLNSNIHRAVHTLSERATAAYEEARVKVQKLLNARESKEIIFVRGATEAINLVAQSYGRANLRAEDEIIVTEMEHHSNIVPWQMLCEQTGAELRVAPIDEQGELLLEEYEKLLGPRTKLVAVVHVSNSLGTINPVKRITELAHAAGAVVLLDGAQAVPHLPVDVQDLDCDFYCLSGHKVYGPTGIGALYGKAKWLEDMPPYQGGGDMIRTVSFKKTTYNSIPYKFEAGTPDISGAIGLGAAIDYVMGLGFAAIAAHEHRLLAYATKQAQEIPGMRLVGTAREKAGILSFVLDHIHPHDVGTILDHQGVAIRTGHHCCMPVMEHYCVPATARASFALYNSKEDVDALMEGIRVVQKVFR